MLHDLFINYIMLPLTGIILIFSKQLYALTCLTFANETVARSYMCITDEKGLGRSQVRNNSTYVNVGKNSYVLVDHSL